MARNELNTAAAYRAEAAPRDWPRWAPLGLVAGDLVMFGLFVVIGRRSHAEGAPISDIVAVAAPFALGWLAIAPWTGLYGRAGNASWRAAISRVGLAWLLACPIGLALRSLAWGHEFKPAFAITTFIFNLLTLSLWRGLLARFLKAR